MAKELIVDPSQVSSIVVDPSQVSAVTNGTLPHTQEVLDRMQSEQHQATGPLERATGAFKSTVMGTLDMAAPIHPDEMLEAGKALKGGDYIGALHHALRAGPAKQVEDVIRSHVEQGTKAIKDLKAGRKNEATGRAAAAAIPIVGPAIAQFADQVTGEPAMPPGQQVETPHAPDIAGGVGTAAGMAALAATPHVPAVLEHPVVGRMATGGAEGLAGAGTAIAGHPYVGSLLIAHGARRFIRGFEAYKQQALEAELAKIPPAMSLDQVKAQLKARADQIAPSDVSGRVPPELPAQAPAAAPAPPEAAPKSIVVDPSEVQAVPEAAPEPAAGPAHDRMGGRLANVAADSQISGYDQATIDRLERRRYLSPAERDRLAQLKAKNTPPEAGPVPQQQPTPAAPAAATAQPEPIPATGVPPTVPEVPPAEEAPAAPVQPVAIAVRPGESINEAQARAEGRAAKYSVTPGEGTHLDLPAGQVPTARDYQAQARKVWAGHMHTRLKLEGIKTPEQFAQMTQAQVDALAKDIGIKPSSPEKLAAVMERFGTGTADTGAPPAASASLPEGDTNVQGTNPNQPSGGQGAAAQDLPVSEPLRASQAPSPGTPAETEILIPGSSKAIPARYELRELADVQPSHNGITFQPNEKYGLRNDRDYTTKENQGKVVTGATRGLFKPQLHITDNPDATNGPPVIDPFGNAMGGNGRTMILQRVYKSNPAGAEAYRTMLKRKAQQFGIDPAAVDKMKEPVLVRAVSHEHLTGAQEAISDLNKTGTAALTPSEQIMVDSRRVSPATLEDIAHRMERSGPDAKLGDVLKGGSGFELLQRLVDDGVVSPQEQAAYAKDGALTKAGAERIHKLVLGRFVRDPAQLDTLPAAITNKLQRAAAPLAAVEAIPGYSLTPLVHEAMDLLEEAAARSEKRLDLFLKQGSIVARDYSPAAVDLAKRFQKMPAGDLVEAFNQYATDARDAAAARAKGPDLFGNAAVIPPADMALGNAMGTVDATAQARPYFKKAEALELDAKRGEEAHGSKKIIEDLKQRAKAFREKGEEVKARFKKAAVELLKDESGSFGPRKKLTAAQKADLERQDSLFAEPVAPVAEDPNTARALHDALTKEIKFGRTVGGSIGGPMFEEQQGLFADPHREHSGEMQSLFDAMK